MLWTMFLENSDFAIVKHRNIDMKLTFDRNTIEGLRISLDEEAYKEMIGFIKNQEENKLLRDKRIIKQWEKGIGFRIKKIIGEVLIEEDGGKLKTEEIVLYNNTK